MLHWKQSTKEYNNGSEEYNRAGRASVRAGYSSGVGKAFRKRLIDDELSFRAWLIAAMKAYLQQPRGKP